MLIDLIKRNRSFRNFDSSRKISRDELESLVEAARFCPSARNLQTLKFYLSNDADINRQILQNIRFVGSLQNKTFPYPKKEATAYIVICHDEKISGSPEKFWMDVGIATQAMMLSAAEMGLGRCMVRSMNKENIKKAPSLPDNLSPQLILVLGKPDETVKITTAENGDTAYYRLPDDTHVVPKRPLAELIIRASLKSEAF